MRATWVTITPNNSSRSPPVASAPLDELTGRIRHGRSSIAPEDSKVLEFTVTLRGANRAKHMTPMIGAPASHTMLAAPARSKVSLWAAGHVASRNEIASRQLPSACLSPAIVIRGCGTAPAVLMRRAATASMNIYCDSYITRRNQMWNASEYWTWYPLLY